MSDRDPYRVDSVMLNTALTPRTPTRAVPCPACMAGVGLACSVPDDTASGRHTVAWLHDSRVPRETYPSRYRFGKPDPDEGFGAPL